MRLDNALTRSPRISECRGSDWRTPKSSGEQMAEHSSQQPFDEADLIVRLRTRSPRALEEAYDRYGPMVYETAYRITGCPAEASDIVQEVFLRLTASVQTFSGRGSFTGWLRKVALRAALMKCRARRRRAEVSLEQAPLPFTRRHAPAGVESIALEQALATLSPSLRTVFLLKVVEGYSHDEIAQSLGIRRGTSEVRLHRARQSLQQQLTA